MAFRFQWLSSLWHLEHLPLFVSFADCCLSTDYKYCRVPQTTMSGFFQFYLSLLSTLCQLVGSSVVVCRPTLESQEETGSQLLVDVTLCAPLPMKVEVNVKGDPEMLQASWKSKYVTFCHNWNPESHFKPSQHKRNTRENSIELHFPVVTEAEEGWAGAEALLQGCVSIPDQFWKCRSFPFQSSNLIFKISS